MKKNQAFLMILLSSFITFSSWGQSAFPNKPVHIVIPFPPGGSTDVLGRLLGASMSSNLGQTVVIENTGGAGGTIGATKVARSANDGYTLLFHNMAHASAPALYSKLPYNPISDFEAIGIVTEVPMILVARKNFPTNQLNEILTMAKNNGNPLNFANAGVGATSQLCEALLKSTTSSQWTSVPYKGTGPALNDILGGQVDFICDQPASTIAHIKAGNLKPIAVATKNRLKILPQVPTFSESGVPGFELTVWHGLYAPKGTPKEVIDRLATSLREALKDPILIERFQEMSASIATPAQANPEALQSFLRLDVDRWKFALKAAGIQPE